MRTFLPAFVLAALVIPAPASAQLTLTMEGGLVTLVAKDVPLSTIMAEWAKIGRAQVVNGDKIFTPVTLHLENVPERRALDILLRNAAGYMLAERTTPLAGASTFDRIMILPTSRPPANAPPLQQAVPAPFAPPRPMPMPVPVDDQDPDPVSPPNVMPGQNPPMQIQPGQPNQPQAPLTAPRPGMITPPPQQPVPLGAPRPGGGGAPTTPAGPGGGGGSGA